MKHFFLSIPHCLYNLKKMKKGWYERFKKKRVCTLCRASYVSMSEVYDHDDNKEFNRRKNPYETRDHMVVCVNLIYTLENCSWKNSTGSRILIAVELCKRKIRENKLTHKTRAHNIMPFITQI